MLKSEGGGDDGGAKEESGHTDIVSILYCFECISFTVRILVRVRGVSFCIKGREKTCVYCGAV